MSDALFAWIRSLDAYQWIVMVSLLFLLLLACALVYDHERLEARLEDAEGRLAELEGAVWAEEPEPALGPAKQPAGVVVEQWAHQLTETMPTHGRHAHPNGARAKRSGND